MFDVFFRFQAHAVYSLSSYGFMRFLSGPESLSRDICLSSNGIGRSFCVL